VWGLLASEQEARGPREVGTGSTKTQSPGMVRSWPPDRPLWRLSPGVRSEDAAKTERSGKKGWENPSTLPVLLNVPSQAPLAFLVTSKHAKTETPRQMDFMISPVKPDPECFGW
jgi:hypothetical protein